MASNPALILGLRSIDANASAGKFPQFGTAVYSLFCGQDVAKMIYYDGLSYPYKYSVKFYVEMVHLFNLRNQKICCHDACMGQNYWRRIRWNC